MLLVHGEGGSWAAGAPGPRAHGVQGGGYINVPWRRNEAVRAIASSYQEHCVPHAPLAQATGLGWDSMFLPEAARGQAESTGAFLQPKPLTEHPGQGLPPAPFPAAAPAHAA